MAGFPVVAWTQRWVATAVAAVVLVACALPQTLADGDPQAGATGLDLRVATTDVYAGDRDCHVFGLPGGDHRMLLAELVLP